MSYRESCPYCGKMIEINHDDGYGMSEIDIHNQQCDFCEKYFTYTTSITINHYLRRAECLNDGNHIYEPTKTYPIEATMMRCVSCGRERPLTEAEKLRLNITTVN